MRMVEGIRIGGKYATKGTRTDNIQYEVDNVTPSKGGILTVYYHSPQTGRYYQAPIKTFKSNMRLIHKPVKLSPEEKAKQMVKDDRVSFEELYRFMRSNDLGFWDGINHEDIIKEYVSEMMQKGIHVSHIAKALETNPSKHRIYKIWLDNSMETPEPINNKKQLYNALFD